MKNLLFIQIPLLVIIIVLIFLGLYILKEITNQRSSIKTMIIGLAIILLAMAINMFIITKVVAILGVLVVIYGSRKIE
ncbi:hypothetical protein [Clostridium sp.]|uniref:hypothetical protein n=1 Tax=Clostridium sp. TaxID=1506 RepID=UPI00290B02A8|nr:hypothetical protein [Clostridium sp.]MDU5106728.1 hypothetical protein [Clostridium sp.]